MSDDSTAALVAYYYQLDIEDYCIAAGAALLLYEYAITLHREVHFMWRSGINRSTAISLLNRCIMIFMAIMYVMDLPFWTSIASGKALIVLDGLINDASGAMWAVFSGLRVYAVCERRWSPAVLTMILGFAPVAMNLAYQAASSLTVDDGTIQQLVRISDSTQLKMEISSRICVVVSDAIVAATTWYRVRGYYNNEAAQSDEERSTVGHLLLRDGTLYSSFLLLLNIVTVVLWYQNITLGLANLTSALTSIFISRLMLSLREASFDPDDPTGLKTTRSGAGSTLQFRQHQTDLELQSIETTEDLQIPSDHILSDEQ